MIRSLPTLDFHEKQRARRFMYAPITFIIIGVFILIAGYNVWDMYQKSRHTAEALEKTKDAYDTLAARQEFLDGRIKALSTDAGVETEIRERFGVAKEGEEVIVVLSDDAKQAPAAPKESLWAKLKSWFSGPNDDYIRE